MKIKVSDPNIYVAKDIKKKHLKELADYRDNFLRKNPELRSLFIEMTLNCNQHCRHCGSSCGDVVMQDQLTDQEIKDFLLQTKNDLEKNSKKLPFLNVTGGEPLLRKNFVELMTYAKELGYNWGMTTNALLVTQKLAKSLKEAGMYSVGVSLDGLEETHDWFRQSPGSYKRVLKATKILVETGFDNVMVTTVVHKRNINELEEIYKVVKELNCDTWRIINVDPIGRAATDDEIRLDTMDYKYIIDFITENRAKDNELEICYGCNHFLGYKYEREIRPWYFLCNAGVYTAGIFYNGDIGACLDIARLPETIQGNIRTDNFYDTWINKFEIFRYDRTLESNTCSQCKHRKECGGDGFHTWNVETKEPNLCMYNELKKAKKIEKEQLKCTNEQFKLSKQQEKTKKSKKSKSKNKK